MMANFLGNSFGSSFGSQFGNWTGATGFTALTVIQASHAGPTNVVSTTFADTGLETAALTLGRTYALLYGGCCGADNSARNTELQLLHGASQIGHAGGEGASTTVTPTNSPGLHGSTILTGAGSTLKIQAKTSAGTGQFQALWVIAIDITDIAAGVHSSINDTTTELLSNVGTAAWEDVVDQTWNFGASPAKWLIVGCFEADFDAYTEGRTSAGRLLVGGAQACSTQSKEGEDPTDVYNFAFATLQTLSGNVQVQMQAISGGTAETDVRRARLFALPLASLAQATTDTWDPVARQTTTNGSPQSVTDLQNTYTPTVAGAHALILLSTNTRCGVAAQTHVELYDSTNAVSYHVDSGDNQNDNSDDPPVWLAICPQPAGATVYLPRVSSSDGATTAGIPSNNGEHVELIMLELAR